MAAIMRGLEAEAYDRQYSDKELIRRLLTYFLAHKKKLTLIGIALTLLALINAAIPLLTAYGIQLLTETNNDIYLPWLIFGLLLLAISNWGINWIRRQFSSEILADIVLQMREETFAAAANQDLSFYDQFSSGRIISRISSDTQEFGEVVLLATDVFNQVIVAIILLIALVQINIQLTLAVLIMTPFIALTAISFRNLARRVTRQGSRVMADVNASIQEVVTGIRVAKNFRQEQTVYASFMDVNQLSYTINVRRGFVLANIFPTLNALAGVGTAILVYWGGKAAVLGTIELAAWYLFVDSVGRFWFPVMNVSAFWSQLQAGLSASERIFALIDSESAVTQIANNPPPLLNGHIRFEHLSFRYTDQEQILSDFSLAIPAGETIALAGHTGAGKSSIIKLIARFYEFQEGGLYIDDVDIRTFDLPQYRKQIGIVSQNPFLFDGTVLENIQYGCPEATEAEVLSIAEQIGNGEWLNTLPQGIHSPVGERGSRLSMGQRQLVALLRVLIQKPRIFILDEATASVDPFTEAQIQQAIDLITKERTSIVIAHRLSTIRNADRILVMANGAIIEEGTHDQLLLDKGNYATLYETYFRHQSLDYIDSREWERIKQAAQ